MHLMLDIETLGTKPGCIVMQVGIVRFDHEVVYPGSLQWNIDVMDQLRAGLTIDPDTLYWWHHQDEVVQNLVMHAESSKYRLPLALQSIRATIDSQLTDKRFKLWANPDLFDLPILADLFYKNGEEIPWPHRQTADARTFLWAAGITSEQRTKPHTPHHALSDATAQAKDVILAARTLGVDLR